MIPESAHGADHEIVGERVDWGDQENALPEQEKEWRPQDDPLEPSPEEPAPAEPEPEKES